MTSMDINTFFSFIGLKDYMIKQINHQIYLKFRIDLISVKIFLKVKIHIFNFFIFGLLSYIFTWSYSSKEINKV